jgi:DNA polymerase V
MVMENNIFSADYKGSKNYTQWEVPTANATGFGAAADDYAERGIDLNEQLIRNKPATFFMRVNSEAMVDASIFRGDVVVVDRSIQPTNGKVIIAVVDGEMLIRRLEISQGKKKLVADTSRLSSIDVDDSSFYCWGVVTYVIHSV